MLEKKLLTVVCVLGILLCGACFLPKLPEHQPPAPPPPIASLGVHSICVSVTNRSESRHIDPAALTDWVIEGINRHTQAGWPKAFRCDSGKSDAMFQVSIASESVTSEQNNPASPLLRYIFHLQIDSALVTPDGTIIWKESDRNYQSDTRTLAASIDPWKSPNFDYWVHSQVCYRLVSRMLFQDH